jgi:hypothetical protein
MQTGELANQMSADMAGYRPNTAFTPAGMPQQASAQMGGFFPSPSVQMAGYRPNVASTNSGGLMAPSLEGYGASLQQASDNALNAQRVEEIDAQIAANNAKIAQLRQELANIQKGSDYADSFDMRLAANRAEVGDLANAQVHLGRIEARKNARDQRENAERLRLLEKVGSTAELDDLLKLAKMRSTLESVADDPNMRDALSREYNIMAEAYRQKYKKEPDFTGFEGKVDVFKDRGGYSDASDKDIGENSKTLDNFVTSKTNTSGRWQGSDEDLKRAIEAARKQGNAKLEKSLKNMWTEPQFRKYLADMNKEGEALLGKLKTLEHDLAVRDGKFTDKDNRTWTMTNGKWKSTDYKWNGKRNGV